MSMMKILVVDDEPSMREWLEIMLRKEKYRVQTAPGGREALAILEKDIFDLVISDMMMAGIGGLELLKNIKDASPDTEVIMVTAFASMETAVEAMKNGAYDYITKPFNVDELKVIIRKVFQKKRLEVENKLLKREVEERGAFGKILGSSLQMRNIYDLIEKIAATRTNILIEGESGTGKEIVANEIHRQSPRRDKPFVTINCGAIPEGLMESELFGHMKGAFTGSVSNKTGLFEMADGGTVFLDEIGELPLHIQVKLLRVIQERCFRRVGGTQDINVDVRIIAATNRTLEAEVKKGTFREDLFYRLNVIQIQMPPLRERLSDIPVLAGYFLEKYAKEQGKKIESIAPETMKLLETYGFPGNVRELENIIERGVTLEQGRILNPDSLPGFLIQGNRNNRPSKFPTSGIDLEKAVEEFEKDLLIKALEMSGGRKKKAAHLLNISFRSMRYRLEKYGMGTESGAEEEGEE